ncbi:hypothetical protein [Halostella litorea]|uniref:hypothetical protein n=1 Tax=Halostella litorea TaxID=2528831 RepID=UPI0010929ADA|nr:hypothetical protein [Halostella litorea]
MRRRTYLRRAAAAGALAVGVAGCAKRDDARAETATVAKNQTPVADRVPDLPVEERTEVIAAAIEDAARADVDSAEAFAAALDERGVPPVYLEPETDAVLALEYVADPGGVLEGIGVVAGAYAAFVAGGDPQPELAATLLDEDETAFGGFHAFADWAAAYEAGERSAAAYGEMVLGTVETTGRIEPPLSGR